LQQRATRSKARYRDPSLHPWLTNLPPQDSMGGNPDRYSEDTTMELPAGLRLSFDDRPSVADEDLLGDGLGEYNAAFLQDNSYASFGLFVRDDAGAIRAGLIGHVYAGWLFIKYLWVRRELRRGGIGSGLLAEAERRALALGCHSAWLDTFSFQGPAFYPKFGYREFGRLDYPPGHQRIFLQKQLTAE
jgi:GNAT superfamily N-acetyltransferase